MRPDIDLVIRQGNRMRTVPPASLAAVLRLPSATIHEALSWLLFASSNDDASPATAEAREPTEGVGNDRSVNVTNVPKEYYSPRRERNVGEGRGLGEGGKVLDAATLADLLADHANLSALEVLVARHPPDELRRALTITLSRPAVSIRMNRAAYLTGVLRMLEAQRRTPTHSYARKDSLSAPTRPASPPHCP